MSFANSTKNKVVIVGAGIAGTVCGIFLARKGIEVSILEINKNPGDFKRMCTHFIQPLSNSVIDKLNISEDLLKSGALHNGLLLNTGKLWVDFGKTFLKNNCGYSIRREVLDPKLRDIAQSAGVKFVFDAKVVAIEGDEKSISSIIAEVGGETKSFPGEIFVACDGSNSTMAKLLGNTEKQAANGRFAQFAYFKGLTINTKGKALGWLVNNGESHAYIIPQDNDYYVASCYISRSKEEEWFANKEESFYRLFNQLTDTPLLNPEQQASKMISHRKLINTWRSPVIKNVAFVGDAACTSDPASGIGCSFALLSADLLCTELLKLDSLQDGKALNVALRRYSVRQRFKVHLASKLIALGSSGKRIPNIFYSPLEKIAGFLSIKSPLGSSKE